MPNVSAEDTPKDQPSTSNKTGAAGVSQGVTEANKGIQVKVELKNAIQSRRAALGLDALQMSSGRQGSQVEKLTPEEEEKRKLRKERNKIAASKCRERKKRRISNLQQEAVGLEELNRDLQFETAKLRHERDGLMQILETHTCVCVPTPSKPGSKSPVQAGI